MLTILFRKVSAVLKMKVIFLLLVCCLYANASFFSMFGLQLGPECISLTQLYKATETMCGLQRDNKTLWNAVIECHRPLTDEVLLTCILFEKLNKVPCFRVYTSTCTFWVKIVNFYLINQFMRASGEAQCPLPKYVLEPNNTAHSIEDVFFNICGLVNGTWSDFFSVSLDLWFGSDTDRILINFQAGSCIISGSSDPYIMTHSDEVARVKAEHYPELPCEIGVLNRIHFWQIDWYLRKTFFFFRNAYWP